MQEKVKRLIQKHTVNQISKEERKELRETVASIPDREINDILSALWTESTASMKGVDFDQFAKTLGIKPKEKNLKWFIRVAAAVVVILLAGSSYWLYLENSRLSEFLHSDVSVTVKSGEMANMALPDGSIVMLNSATTITYPSNFGYDKRNIYLSGEAFLKVAKNEEIPFFVDTEHLQIEVLGTQFNIVSYGNLVETTLLEGSIKLTTKNRNPQTIVLVPNQKAIYSTTTGKLDVQETTTYFETAWTHGELVFRSVDFMDIITKLEQRYGLEIELEGGQYDKALFTGSFKENSVFDVLKKLNIHYDFSYKTAGYNKIIIKFN